MLNAPRTAERFWREVMFENERTCAVLLRDWRQQLPSNQGDTETNVMRRVAEFITRWGRIYDYISLPQYLTVLWVAFKRYTLYHMQFGTTSNPPLPLPFSSTDWL